MVSEKESGLQHAKENLAKYRMFEGEREIGYDGNHEWDPKDPLVLEAQAYFYKAVKKRYFLEVRSFLAILMPNGGEDGRLAAIQLLLTNIYSEEALKEALLLSIATGSRPLVEFVLALFIDCPYLERSGCANSNNFPPHMTPLMLACIQNSVSIVQCLLLRGHTIQIPHFLACECTVCKRQTVMTGANTRIVDVMRAVSSEAYLWLATDDVIAATCAVARDLQQLIREDALEQVETYRVLETNVQRFMARVSDHAWRTEEFNVLVTNKNHCARRNTELSSPRLHLAMDSHMRQFTCSTNTQNAMRSMFRADWYNLGNKRSRDAWRFLRASILMPFLVMWHAFRPDAATTMSIPIARYIAHCTTYTLFFVALIGRNVLSEWLEPLLYAYIVGLLVEKACLFYRLGASTFFAFWWRWFDVALIGSFLVSMLFYVAARCPREHFDPLTVDRAHWPSGEFVLLHEIFLSVSCVLGISRIFYYLQMIQGIGGSVISVGKCVGKTYTYLVIMLVIIFSFSIGLNILVGPYSSRKSMSPDWTVDQRTTDDYDTISTSSKNLFWSIFGYLGPSTYITVVGNTGHEMEPVEHRLNSATLEVLGALYHGIIIITVMNLMTSLLVKKADEVLDNEETEFKYTRAAIYAEFMPWQMAAPPPLNLILIPLHLFHRKVTNIRSPTWGSKPGEEEKEEGVEDGDVAEEEEVRKKGGKEEKGAPTTITSATTSGATEWTSSVVPVQKTSDNDGDGNEEEEEKKKRTEVNKKTCIKYPYLTVLLTVFRRFCAAKECKYHSVWRSDLEKEEKQSSKVAFLPVGCRPYSMDNTYEGFRMRTTRRMVVDDDDDIVVPKKKKQKKNTKTSPQAQGPPPPAPPTAAAPTAPSTVAPASAQTKPQIVAEPKKAPPPKQAKVVAPAPPSAPPSAPPAPKKKAASAVVSIV